jgi:hypothetical protein
MIVGWVSEEYEPEMLSKKELSHPQKGVVGAGLETMRLDQQGDIVPYVQGFRQLFPFWKAGLKLPLEQRQRVEVFRVT